MNETPVLDEYSYLNGKRVLFPSFQEFIQDNPNPVARDLFEIEFLDWSLEETGSSYGFHTAALELLKSGKGSYWYHSSSWRGMKWVNPETEKYTLIELGGSSTRRFYKDRQNRMFSINSYLVREFYESSRSYEFVFFGLSENVSHSPSVKIQWFNNDKGIYREGVPLDVSMTPDYFFSLEEITYSEALSIIPAMGEWVTP